MGECSVRIADDESGLRMATRDAFESDAGEPRVIERVDLASGKFSTPIGSAQRGHNPMLDAADTSDLTNLPADLTNHLITVGDKSMLCVAVEQTVVDGTVTITPIIYDNEETPGIVGALPQRVFSPQNTLRRGNGSGNYLLPIQMWDSVGAYKIGLHITAFTGTGNTFKVWGWVI